MSNEKEREKAKQKNIAVIENAIAARNKVRVFTAQKSSSIVSRFFLFLKISFFSLKGERNCCRVVLVLVLVLVLVERNVREEDEEKRASV